MIYVLIFLIALFIGIFIGYLLGKRNVSAAEQHAAELTEQVKESAVVQAALAKEVELLQRQLVDEKNRAEIELSRQKTELEQRLKEAEEARRNEFKQQLELVKSELKRETDQTNRQSIVEIMTPYRQQLEQIKQQNTEDRATLQNEIKRFVETGGRLTREADRLVTALSGSVTIQGNLGEKLLKDLLAGSGLVEGKQYKLQNTVRNEDGTVAKNSDGKRMRPDAVLIYPETNSILYIDSKFQLPAELDFEKLNTEDQRGVLKSFADKISDQAKKLSDRNYDRSNSEGYIPLPYVIMFVPSEAALTAVTNFDRTLWQRMFSEYGVCLASERNLLVLIEMVRYMWQRQVTIDNHEAIIKRAEVILDRVIDFMEEFKNVESALDDAIEAKDKMKRLSNSPGHSIEVAVRKLAALGIKPNKVKKIDRPARLRTIMQNADAVDEVEFEELDEKSVSPED